MSHDPNCAIVRAGDLRAWCDCPHGGNRIPDSYLAKFLPKQEHEDLSYDLRLFLDGMDIDNRLIERHTDQHE